MPYISSFSTSPSQFRTRQTDWRDRRDQTTPVLNKILDELVKRSNWTQQHIFLSRCREHNVIPKGLKVKIPKGIMNRDQEIRLKKKCESELLQKTIKRLFIKQQKSDEKIATMKLDLQNKFRMSRNWIENTLKWLRKKAENKSTTKNKSLKRKFDI